MDSRTSHPGLAVEHVAAPELRLNDLPTAVEEVDAAWLTRILGMRHPGVVVSSVTIPRINWGTATKLSLALEYSALPPGLPLPRHMLLKGGFDAAMRKRVWAAYRAEALFYGQLGRDMPIALPRTYFEGIDSTSHQALILMEDLEASQCSFGDASRPINLDQASAALTLLAALHARWWDDERQLSKFDWKDSLRVVLKRWLLDDHWSAQFARNKHTRPGGILADREKVTESLEQLWRLQGSGRCIVHGDLHLGNIYFTQDGAPRFLDWQVVHTGHWAHDVAYFLVGALTVEDRRSAERDLLQHYLVELSRHGVAAPDRDDAWLAYRRDIIHGYVSWFLTPSDMQPAETLAAFAERYHAAMVDHDTMRLLGHR
ncbi:phosphotransferase [Sphingobium sp. JS3065]|uniref:oxidoreductase family protein n=1 Tax=Sphingobium sp. JS3065 TaxID=2970925 RepID=UPI0022655ACA|nr:oxidoreductase family protein [Sphingobium sp. JS3065]UZW57502.1 phosphotransferase [Sphingobium sp. JS3065]